MENFNVAYCGLYCGACKRLKKGKCLGCQSNEKATWCEIRKCCRENDYTSCADCRIISLKECKKHNNIFARFIEFVTWTDRSKCVDLIKIMGMQGFSKEMDNKNRMSVKR